MESSKRTHRFENYYPGGIGLKVTYDGGGGGGEESLSRGT
jgi:hypothetical protein